MMTPGLHPSSRSGRTSRGGGPCLDHNDLQPWNIFADGDVTTGRAARDVYLEVFDLAPHTELVEELEVACRVGKTGRALTWDRALGGPDSDRVDEFVRATPQWFAALLADS
jgi:hypothetical protein